VRPDLLALVSIACALVSACGAVFSVWVLSRGTDAELKADVEELAVLVERLAKVARREKMSRVRQSAEPPQIELPVTPPTDYPTDLKTALRRRVATMTHPHQR